MKTSDSGINFILKNHGFLPHADKQSGKLMIGCRHELHDSEIKHHSICTTRKEIMWRNGLTNRDAALILADDLYLIETDLRQGLAKAPEAQHEFDALAAFVFDIGRLDWLNSDVRVCFNWSYTGRALERWALWGNPEIRKAEIRLYQEGIY